MAMSFVVFLASTPSTVFFVEMSSTIIVYLITCTTIGTTLTITNGFTLPLIIFYALKSVLSCSFLTPKPDTLPSSTLFFLLSFNAAKCRMIINQFKLYMLKFFRFNRWWYKFIGLNRFVSDQVTKFNQYILQDFIFNDLTWLQLVDVDKHNVTIKFINGDK